MKSFLTGSHVYGKPTRKSDIDLVILGSKSLIKNLRLLGGIPNGPIVFGKLNLIICESEEEFEAWRAGTREMRKAHLDHGSIFDTAAAAVVLDAYRKTYGITTEANYPSGKLNRKPCFPHPPAKKKKKSS